HKTQNSIFIAEITTSQMLYAQTHFRYCITTHLKMKDAAYSSSMDLKQSQLCYELGYSLCKIFIPCSPLLPASKSHS
ncbi:hypothetical protein KI387_015793, partial [Taxus chinensis]